MIFRILPSHLRPAALDGRRRELRASCNRPTPDGCQRLRLALHNFVSFWMRRQSCGQRNDGGWRSSCVFTFCWRAASQKTPIFLGRTCRDRSFRRLARERFPRLPNEATLGNTEPRPPLLGHFVSVAGRAHESKMNCGQRKQNKVSGVSAAGSRSSEGR